MPIPIPGHRPEGYDNDFWENLSKDTASAFKKSGHDWDSLPSEQRDECIRTHNRAMQQSYNDQ